MKVLIIALSLCSSFSLAAVPSAHRAQESTSKLDQVEMALNLPFPNRLTALQNQGASSLEHLKALAKDKKQSLQMRWRALMSMGVLFPKASQPDLITAVKSPQWFMRNAGILALSHGDRETALEWARKLLEDKALVVRTAAVQTIDRLHGQELAPVLWEQLNSQKNFKGGESLWVRKHIARALSSFAHKGQEARFASLLADPDPRIHQYAVQALEKITGQRRDGTVEEKRSAWIQWWRNQG